MCSYNKYTVCFLTLGPGFPSSPMVPGAPFGPGGPFKMQESDETVSHLCHVLVIMQ